MAVLAASAAKARLKSSRTAAARADILALEPEVGPDYSIGMFTPDQGMSINPYRQVTVIAADFARRGGRIGGWHATQAAQRDE